MGGLARRATYIKAFDLRSKGEVPTLFVDAGNLFSDDRFSAGKLPAEVVTKNKWVLQAYGEFDFDAANISFNDLAYMNDLLKKDGYDKRLDQYPFLSKVISANVQPTDGSLNAPAPYVIKEISLHRGDPGTFKVGIVGFTDGKPTSTTAKETQIAGFQIADPYETAKKVLPELKKKVNYIVALAYMTEDRAQTLATQNPEINSIVVAHQLTNMNDPQHFNQATLTVAYSQTKFLGELRVYLKNDGQVQNQTNRYIAMDDSIPDDPVAASEVSSAHSEFTNQEIQSAQQQAAAASPTPPTANLLPASNSPYVGVDECAKCHQREYNIWKTTNHSHAIESLQKKNEQFDPSCIKCHVVGFQQGGFQALYSTPQFANVQCEACHGPGREHAKAPAKGYGFVATPAGCVQCHTQSNSPDFNFVTYYPKIKH